MPTKVLEEQVELNRLTAGMSETDASVSTGEGLQTAWEYAIPVGHALIFTQEDHFAAYLSTTAPAECGVGSLIDIVIADAGKTTHRTILHTIRYAQARGSATTFLAFQDKDYFNHLDIPVGQQVIANEGERLLIRVNVNGTLDASLSYWVLTCKRVRHTLFD